MPTKCPECKKEITHLFLYEKVEEKSWFALDNHGDGNAESVDAILLGEREDFECPECSLTLFTDWESAEKFLQGKED